MASDTAETVLFVLGLVVFLVFSAWLYWRTSDDYRVRKAKLELGYEVDDVCSTFHACCTCCCGVRERRKWERENLFYRTDEYGPPDPHWMDVKAADQPGQEWQRLPRGDVARQRKLISTVLAKTKVQIMEEVIQEAIRGGLAAFAADCVANIKAQQRIEAFQARARAMAEQEQRARAQREAELAAARAREEQLEIEREEAIAAEEDGDEPGVEFVGAGALLDTSKVTNARSQGASSASVISAASSSIAPAAAASTSAPASTSASTSAAAAVHAPPPPMVVGNPLSLSELRKHAQAIDHSPLTAEFNTIDANLPGSSHLPDGASKLNRNPIYFPFERSRVRLGNEYINASFVRGPNNEPERFIVTQGPLPKTIETFWRMVWEHHCAAIVMLTDVDANSSAQYWPAKKHEDLTFGVFNVYLKQETQKAGYTSREITLSNTASADREHRRVMHFQFQEWPVNGVPQSTAPVLAMLHEVHSATRKSPAPVVIHDAAGAGPAGTVVAIEHGISALESKAANKTVDVKGIVTRIREDRGGLVQTDAEYIFVHKTLCMFSLASAAAPPAYVQTPKFDADAPPDFDESNPSASSESEDELALAKALDNRTLPRERRATTYAPVDYDAARDEFSGFVDNNDEFIQMKTISEPPPPLPAGFGDGPADDFVMMRTIAEEPPPLPPMASTDFTALPVDDLERAPTPPGAQSPSWDGVPEWKRNLVEGKAGSDLSSSRPRTNTLSTLPSICANCESSAATLRCSNCAKSHCESCDAAMHSSGEMRGHQRQPIAGVAGTLGMAAGIELCALCEVTPATVECRECDGVKLCQTCDVNVIHQGSKQGHARRPIGSAKSPGREPDIFSKIAS